MDLNSSRLSAYRRAAGVPETADAVSAGPPVKKQALSDSESRIAAGLLKVPAMPSSDDIRKTHSESAYRRVAKFLLLIGTDEAAKVIAHLTPEQIERIVPEIASIRSVDPGEASVIMAEFQALLQRSREGGGVETARAILEKAYGAEMAEEMLQKAVPFAGGVPFEYMQEMDSSRVYFLLRDESPAVQALVLSRLKPALAAGVIKRMGPDEQKEAVFRLARLSSVPPDMLRRIDQAMHEKVLAANTSSAEQMDGRDALSEILKRMAPSAEQSILDSLAEKDPELGSDIRDRLFTIHDVVNADDRFIQEELHRMQSGDIAVLIAGKPADFRTKILRNISKSRAGSVLEEEKFRQPVLKRDSDRVTAAFFSVLRRAWEEGRLIIRDRDDDVYV